MNKESVLKAIKELKDKSKKRKFTQTVDLIINLKNLDLKKNEEQVDFFMQLHNDLSKEVKTCAFIGPELLDETKAACDTVVLVDDFPKYADKKLVKKLADEHDYFIAQANIMTKVAAAFGKTLGPRGKMPNPKAGCVIPPKTNLKNVVSKLKKTLRISAKKEPVVKCVAGKETDSDEMLAENVMAIYDQLIHHLSNGEHNIRNIILKLTMSERIKIG